jgi:hypothetical protein
VAFSVEGVVGDLREGDLDAVAKLFGEEAAFANFRFALLAGGDGSAAPADFFAMLAAVLIVVAVPPSRPSLWGARRCRGFWRGWSPDFRPGDRFGRTAMSGCATGAADLGLGGHSNFPDADVLG